MIYFLSCLANSNALLNIKLKPIYTRPSVTGIPSKPDGNHIPVTDFCVEPDTSQNRSFYLVPLLFSIEVFQCISI